MRERGDEWTVIPSLSHGSHYLREEPWPMPESEYTGTSGMDGMEKGHDVSEWNEREAEEGSRRSDERGVEWREREAMRKEKRDSEWMEWMSLSDSFSHPFPFISFPHLDSSLRLDGRERWSESKRRKEIGKGHLFSLIHPYLPVQHGIENRPERWMRKRKRDEGMDGGRDRPWGRTCPRE